MELDPDHLTLCWIIFVIAKFTLIDFYGHILDCRSLSNYSTGGKPRLFLVWWPACLLQNGQTQVRGGKCRLTRKLTSNQYGQFNALYCTASRCTPLHCTYLLCTTQHYKYLGGSLASNGECTMDPECRLKWAVARGVKSDFFLHFYHFGDEDLAKITRKYDHFKFHRFIPLSMTVSSCVTSYLNNIYMLFT